MPKFSLTSATCVVAVAAYALLFGASVWAQSPPTSSAAQTYSLRYKFASGQQRNYRTSVEVSGSVNTSYGAQKVNEHFDEVIGQEVQSVTSQGQATISTHIQSAEAIIAGQVKPYSPAQLAKMQPTAPLTVSPNGQILSGATPSISGAGDANSYMQIGQAQILPDNPVAIHDTWRNTVSAAGLTLFTRSALDQVTSDSGNDIARISTKYYGMSGSAGSKIHGGPGKSYFLITGTGTMDFDMTTGTVKSVGVTFVTKATIMPSSANSAIAVSQGPVKANLKTTMNMSLVGDD